MEKVQNRYRSGLLRGMYRTVEVAMLSTRYLEKYSAGMGRNCSHHVRLVRQCLGRQSRNRVGPLPRYHSSGRPSVDPPVHYSFRPLRQIALFVVGVAGSLYLLDRCILMLPRDLGFGRRVTWTSDLIVPPGHQMSFKDALHIVSTNVFLKMVASNWVMNLTERTRKVNLAFNELKVPYRN
jgi:hypothetical protein